MKGLISYLEDSLIKDATGESYTCETLISVMTELRLFCKVTIGILATF